MQFLHKETNEWMDEEEIQKRLDAGFDFKCNDCHKSIGKHLSVAANGIFCKPCQQKIINDVQKIVEEKGGKFHKLPV